MYIISARKFDRKASSVVAFQYETLNVPVIKSQTKLLYVIFNIILVISV